MKYLILLLSIVLCISLQAQDETSIIERETSISKEVKVEEENGILNVRIVTTDQDGNQDVMVWKGSADDPDMPEEIKEYIMDEGGQDGRRKKQMRIKVLDEDGNEKILEWDGEGEMPAEMREHMREKGRKLTKEARDMRKNELKERHMEHRKDRAEGGKYSDNNGDREQYRGRGNGRRYANKAKLGIMIIDENGTVVIEEVMDNSAAAKGGMQANDIITVMDDTDIDNLNRLYAELATHNPGDKVKVIVNRGGKKKKLKIVLD